MESIITKFNAILSEHFDKTTEKLDEQGIEKLQAFLKEFPIDPSYNDLEGVLDGPMMPIEQDLARFAQSLIEKNKRPKVENLYGKAFND